MAVKERVEKEIVEKPAILKRLSIFQDYLQWIVMIDISDVVSFEKFSTLDTIFNKMGLIIKRQFGYLGYYWGYGKVKYEPQLVNLPVTSATVSINIYFPKKIDENFLETNAKKFEKIYDYINKEYILYYGNLTDDDNK